MYCVRSVLVSTLHLGTTMPWGPYCPIDCRTADESEGYRNIGYPLNLIFNSNFIKFVWPMTTVSIACSFCSVAQSMAVSLPCSVQNSKMTTWLKNILWTNDFLWDFSLGSSFNGISCVATALRPSPFGQRFLQGDGWLEALCVKTEIFGIWISNYIQQYFGSCVYIYKISTAETWH